MTGGSPACRSSSASTFSSSTQGTGRRSSLARCAGVARRGGGSSWGRGLLEDTGGVVSSGNAPAAHEQALHASSGTCSRRKTWRTRPVDCPSSPRRSPARLTSTHGKPAVSSSVSCRVWVHSRLQVEWVEWDGKGSPGQQACTMPLWRAVGPGSGALEHRSCDGTAAPEPPWQLQAPRRRRGAAGRGHRGAARDPA